MQSKYHGAFTEDSIKRFQKPGCRLLCYYNTVKVYSTREISKTIKYYLVHCSFFAAGRAEQKIKNYQTYHRNIIDGTPV